MAVTYINSDKHSKQRSIEETKIEAINKFVPNASEELKKALLRYINIRFDEIHCAVLSPLVKDVKSILDYYHETHDNKIVTINEHYSIKIFPILSHTINNL